MAHKQSTAECSFFFFWGSKCKQNIAMPKGCYLVNQCDDGTIIILMHTH